MSGLSLVRVPTPEFEEAAQSRPPVQQCIQQHQRPRYASAEEMALAIRQQQEQSYNW